MENQGYPMKILIVGTGVIGSIYGWQLAEAGHAVTHYVRAGQKSALEERGIPIRCLDARGGAAHGGKARIVETCYRPALVETLAASEADLIVTPVKANQLDSVLPLLAQASPRATLLFLQNLWVHHIQQIERCLPPERVLYGQPHIAGGGKTAGRIDCTLFGQKNAPTMIGARDGRLTPRLAQVQAALASARLNPLVSRSILTWLVTHYAEADGLVAGVIQAGGASGFLADARYFDTSMRMIREGFRVCARLGYRPWSVYPQALYYAPLGLLRRMYYPMLRSEETRVMMEGHLAHSPDEMKEMFHNVLASGEALGLPMPLHRQLLPLVDAF
jgi:2-dehydropantoate 2-reductase